MGLKSIYTVYWSLGRRRFKSVVHANSAEDAVDDVKRSFEIGLVIAQEQIDPVAVQDQEWLDVHEPKGAGY